VADEFSIQRMDRQRQIRHDKANSYFRNLANVATNNEGTLILISKWWFIHWQNWNGGQGWWLYKFL